MTLDSLMLERKDGADYTLRFEPGVITVEYFGTEISDYLRQGFAPLHGENIFVLDERMEDIRTEREEMIQTGKYSELPDSVDEHFAAKYNAFPGESIVTKYTPTTKAAGADAIIQFEKYSPAVIHSASRTLDLDIWEHELIHQMMSDNPSTRAKAWQESLFFKLDMLPLPIAYSPVDSPTAFCEAAPPAFGCECEEVLAVYAFGPLTDHFLGSLPLGAVAILMDIIGSNPLPGDIPNSLAYFAGVCGFAAAKIPRTIFLGNQLKKDHDSMKSLIHRVGKPEAIKLLACLDRDMLKETVDYMEDNDISF